MSGAADLEAQVQRLDELLEQYLHALHEYDSARRELSQGMARGFLSLAKANASAPPGRRYGRDGYDFRMQAVRRVVGDSEDGVKVAIVEAPTGNEGQVTEKTSQEQTDDAKGEKSKEKTASKPRDPLRWFGFQVPPSLRDAQTSFTGVVEGAVPSVINATAHMRQLEIEIGRTRKSIKKLEKSVQRNIPTTESVTA